MQTVMTFIIGFFITTTAFADSVKSENLIRTPIAGEIESVNALCPAFGTCVTDGTVINLKFQLSSACAKFSLKYTVDSAANVIDVEAIEEVEAQQVCQASVPGPRFEAITLNMMFPPMTLNFLGTGVSYPILPENVIR